LVFEQLGVVAGAVTGVVAVPDEIVPAFQAAAARLGLAEVTAEAYEAAVAAKRKNPRGVVTVDLSPPVPAEVARPLVRPALPPIKTGASGRPATVVDGKSLKEPEAGDHLPLSIDDAVDLGTAAPPEAARPVPPKRKR
jgi:hypothetical protein